MCGAQSQDPAAGRLQLRARHPSLTAAEIERARTEERSLVRMWLMRNTVHLVATDDLRWMRPLFAPLMAAFNRRRLGQLGIGANAQERALSLIEKHLGRDGPLTRTDLSARLESAGIPIDSTRRAHIFPLAVSTGIACIGRGDGAATELIAVGDWLTAAPDAPRDRALAELARRYFAAFGPATEADLAGWAGLPLRDVRAAIAAVAGELREATLGEAAAWQPRGRAPRPLSPGLVRLLGEFDTYLMGHRDRRFIAPGERWAKIGPGGGLLRATIVRGGAALGTWRLRRSKGRLRAELLPFEELASDDAAAIEAELADVGRFEGAAVASA